MKYQRHAILLVLLSGCGQQAATNNSIDQVTRSLNVGVSILASFSIDRVIPITFVQFTDANNPVVQDAALDDQVNAANTIFAPAGIQFTIRSNFVHSGTALTFVDTAHTYTWPTPPSSSPAVSDFNPTCTFTPPASENVEVALVRAGTFCARDGEIVVYLGNRNDSHGVYPWEGNAMIMNAASLASSGNRIFSHELGHYLGLPHTFQGGGSSVGYDLADATQHPNPNLKNPETGQVAKFSDFWDLVYVPGTPTNIFFGSRASAQPFDAGGTMRTIEKMAAGGALCGEPQGCMGRISCANPYDTWFGTLKMSVSDPGGVAQTLYTSDNGLKGLGASLAGDSPSTPNRAINVMSYNYPPQNNTGCANMNTWFISASQVEQIRRVLGTDIAAKGVTEDGVTFSGVFGRRPRLGVGVGTWVPWESLGGTITDTPAVVSKTANRIDVVGRQTDGVVYNKVFQNNSWWPSQTGWSSIGGSTIGNPALGVRATGELDVVVRFTDTGGYNKVWNPSTGWWPSQTGWASIGGTIADDLRLAERSTGEIDVVALGTDGNAYNKVWSSSTGWWPSQTGWSGLGPSSVVPNILDDNGGTIALLTMTSAGHGAMKRWTSASGWSPSQTTWEDIGGTVSFAPSVTSWGTGRLDVITTLSDSTAANKVWTGTWWPSESGWASDGGSLAGKPSITTWGTGRLDVVGRGIDGIIAYKSWTSAGGWWPSQTEWSKIGGTSASDPVIVTWGAGRLDIFVRGTDSVLWHRARVN